MPLSYASLAVAAASNAHRREDRLTEIYAVALSEHVGFASEVFKLAGLPEADRYDVYTQQVIPSVRGRLDLRVIGYRQDKPVAVLYGEHKEPGGGPGEGQREKYLPELEHEMRRQQIKGRLLWVAGWGDDPDRPASRRASADIARAIQRARQEVEQLNPHNQVVDKTWQDIANCAERAGLHSVTVQDGTTWRQHAESTSALAPQRILRELIWYLEEEGYSVTEALTDAQISRAADAYKLADTLDQLIIETRARLNDRKIGGFTVQKQPRSTRIRLSPETSWIDLWVGEIVVFLDSDLTPRRGGTRTLMFFVGVYLSKSKARALEADDTFLDQVSGANLEFDEKDAFVGAKISLQDVLAGEPRDLLDDQAEMLTKWSVEQLRALLKLKPAIQPVKTSRR